MKKMLYIIILVLLLGTTFPGSAQIRIGLLVGKNFSNMKWDLLDRALEANGSDLEIRTSTCFGTVVEFGLNQEFGLRFEPMYIAKGTNFKGYGGVNQFWAKSTYIEVPCMFQLFLAKSFIQPYLIAGPCVGFKLNAETNDSDIGFGNETIKNIETSLTLGIGANFRLHQYFLVFFEGRYTSGLSTLPKKGKGEIKNYGLQILAGFAFQVKD